MDVITIYERVCHTSPIDTNAFITFFNRTVNELSSELDDKYLIPEDTGMSEIEDVNDVTNIFSDYMTAIIDNILFYASGDAARKTDYVMHKDQAFKKVWHTIHRGKRRTGDVW